MSRYSAACDALRLAAIAREDAALRFAEADRTGRDVEHARSRYREFHEAYLAAHREVDAATAELLTPRSA